MSVVHQLLPCGIYTTVYVREPGEYADLVRRSEERFTATSPRAANDTTTLAMLIQQGLTRADMTINELADELGVQHGSAATWIKNTSPNNQNLKRISEILNIDYLLARKLSGRDPVARRGVSPESKIWNQGIG